MHTPRYDSSAARTLGQCSFRVASQGHAEEVRLLQRALSGNKAAIDEFIRYLEPILLKSAHHVLRTYRPQGSRSDAEDLVQVAWEALIAHDWRVVRGWDPQRKVLLRTYLGLVATRRMIDAVRPELSSRELPTSDDLHQSAGLVEHLSSRTEARGLLSFVVTELSQRLTHLSKEVMRVMYFEDANVQETAQALNLTVGAVRSHKKRIRKLAHDILQEQP